MKRGHPSSFFYIAFIRKSYLRFFSCFLHLEISFIFAACLLSSCKDRYSSYLSCANDPFAIAALIAHPGSVSCLQSLNLQQASSWNRYSSNCFLISSGISFATGQIAAFVKRFVNTERKSISRCNCSIDITSFIS